MRNRKVLFSCFVPLLTAVLASCGPTYPREKIVDGVKNLCKKEYKLDVDVKIVGTTIGVRIPLEGLFDSKRLQISPKAFEKIDGVMLSVSRVALSSDRSIEFYTVITMDKNVPGAEVVLTRYVYDLYRFVYGDISRGEFTKRMVFDIRFNPQGIIDNWLDEFTLNQTNLDEFICKQASRRIIDEFRENRMLAGRFRLSFANGKLEDRIFKFNVDITREGLPMSELIHGSLWHESVLELCLQQISHVIYIYNFTEFDKVEVSNKFDNKVLSIDKSEINKWRKKRVKIG